MITDLWDFDSNPLPEVRSPASLLREQANIFSENMSARGMFAEVRQHSPSRDTRNLVFLFDLLVPSLGDYRLRVARCEFSVRSAYPVKISSDYGDPATQGGFAEAEMEEDFADCLRSIFTDTTLRTSIASLLANSEI
jgi:hypothetical protein